MIIYGSSDATLNPAGTVGHVILLPDHAEDVFGTYRLSVMTDKRTGSFGTWSTPIAADRCDGRGIPLGALPRGRQHLLDRSKTPRAWA